MAKNVLPLRFRILRYAYDVDQFNYYDLKKALQPEYGNDGQFKRARMQLHMDSLRAVGMTEEVKVELEDDSKVAEEDRAKDHLLITYRVTDYGRSRMKYFPKEWQK